jgi:hypothetical protein
MRGQAEQKRQNSIGRAGLAEQDCQEKTGRTGVSGKDFQTWMPGQECRDRTAGIRQPGQDRKNLTTRTGQA